MKHRNTLRSLVLISSLVAGTVMLYSRRRHRKPIPPAIWRNSTTLAESDCSTLGTGLL